MKNKIQNTKKSYKNVVLIGLSAIIVLWLYSAINDDDSVKVPYQSKTEIDNPSENSLLYKDGYWIHGDIRRLQGVGFVHLTEKSGLDPYIDNNMEKMWKYFFSRSTTKPEDVILASEGFEIPIGNDRISMYQLGVPQGLLTQKVFDLGIKKIATAETRRQAVHERIRLTLEKGFSLFEKNGGKILIDTTNLNGLVSKKPNLSNSDIQWLKSDWLYVKNAEDEYHRLLSMCVGKNLIAYAGASHIFSLYKEYGLKNFCLLLSSGMNLQNILYDFYLREYLNSIAVM